MSYSLTVDSDEYTWKKLDQFFQERMKFLPDLPVSVGEREVGSLYVLPMCFYCPPEGESSNPSPEAIVEATKKAYEVWGAESMMQSVYLGYTVNDSTEEEEWDRLDYEQPLRKFNLDGAIV
jgi:hypothetical protein